MIMYVPSEDKIVGAERGSWAWYHEERHRLQYARGVAERLDRLHIVLYYAAFIAGVVGFVFGGHWGWFLGVGIAMTPHIVGLMALEIDAYVMGSWEWWRK